MFRPDMWLSSEWLEQEYNYNYNVSESIHRCDDDDDVKKFELKHHNRS